MFKKYYIAYGSNLNKAHMHSRCPDSEWIGTARLHGFQLLFRGGWNDSYLTIEHAEGMDLPVAVWRISRRDELLMDRYEGFPTFYYKKEVVLPEVSCGDHVLKNIPAFVYIMYEDQEPQVPAMEYVEECMQGYRDCGFDPNLLTEALEVTRRLIDESME